MVKSHIQIGKKQIEESIHENCETWGMKKAPISKTLAKKVLHSAATRGNYLSKKLYWNNE